MTQADKRWEALQARDARARARFVYAVKTTGVYCRPGCASRLPRRTNVRFFDSAALAERAGFRACRRCRPRQLDAPLDQRLVRACRFIEQADRPPALADVAAEVGLNPQYLHRLFRAQLGVTPRAYAVEQRARRLKGKLNREKTVTSAIFAAGYETSGRCYAEADQVLGMTPRAYQGRGRGARIRFATAPCSLGCVLVAATERGVCRISLGEDAQTLSADLRREFPAAEQVSRDAAFARLLKAVVALVEEPSRRASLPLDIRGTAFQRRVWEALREIPAGATRSYAEIAAAIGQPEAYRAVGSACAANALALAIPCHRVVRGDGELSGYRWGLERKRALLKREGATNGRRAQ